jgi:hypothetical protein
MKIITNYNGNNGVEETKQIPVTVTTSTPMVHKTRGTFTEILELGKQNAICETNLDGLKLDGEPLKLDGEDILFKNPINDSLKIIEQSEQFNKQITDFKNLIDNEIDKEEMIMFPIDKIRSEMNLSSKKLRAIGYITLCSMYEGVLVEEKLSMRKGEAYEYKHHRHISFSEFFRILLNDKLEIYRKLGFEKALLIEEILNRMISCGVLLKKQETTEDGYEDGDNKKGEGENYYLENSFYHNRDNWENTDEKISEELKKLSLVNIRFKEPFKIINFHRDHLERLEVFGIQIKQKEGIVFRGKKMDSNYLTEEELDSLDYRIYNYLYRLNEKIIKDVLCNIEYLMKKKLLERQTHCNILTEKCNKFLLLGGLCGVKIDEVTERNY